MEAVVVLTILVVLIACLLPTLIAIQRRRSVAEQAANPVVIGGRAFDAAEVLWSFRQLNESPHLSAVTAESTRSAAQTVSMINTTMSSLPPEHTAQVVQAQLRLQRSRRFREEILRAPRSPESMVPILGDAEIVALAAHDRLPVAPAKALTDGKGVPVRGHLRDAHLPIVSVVMAIAAADGRGAAELDAGRVTEYLAWDIGVTGGSIAAGLGIGTAVVPGLGTVVGGVVGAIGGSLAATRGKRRHLRAAINSFRASCESLGAVITERDLDRIQAEIEELVELKARNLAQLEAEFVTVQSRRSWYRRTFRPTVGLAIAERAIELGYADIQVDRGTQHQLAVLLRSTDCPPDFRGYVWVAGRRHLDWLDHDGPRAEQQVEALQQVRNEMKHLSLAGQ